MNSSPPLTRRRKLAARCAPDALVDANTESVDQLVARVLCRAHLTAAHSVPDEARAILPMAQSCADDPAVAHRRFDWRRFILHATNDPYRATM